MSRGQAEVLGLLIALTSLLLLIAAAGKDCWRVGTCRDPRTHSASAVTANPCMSKEC